MAPPTINWLTITELPLFNSPLFNGDDAPLRLELLPIKANKPREIRVSCTICSTSKQQPIRNQYNWKQTSNYWTHLKTSHKVLYNRLKSSSNDEDISGSDIATSSQSSQSFFYRRPQASISTPSDIKRLITRYLIAINTSFNSVLSIEFKELIATLNSTISPPSKLLLINDIDNFYTEQFISLKNKLLAYKAKGAAFNLCINTWTSLSQKAFLGITIHQLNSEWKIESYLLRLCPLNKRHSGKYLYKVLIKTLKDFDIDKNILTITCDNASNNKQLIQYFSDYNKDLPTGYFIKDIRCLAHIVNLIVQDILSEIKGTITQKEYINISRISEDIEESAIILPTTQLTI